MTFVNFNVNFSTCYLMVNLGMLYWW